MALSVTTSASQVVATADATDAIVNGFRVSVPGAIPAAAPAAAAPAAAAPPAAAMTAPAATAAAGALPAAAIRQQSARRQQSWYPRHSADVGLVS